MGKYKEKHGKTRVGNIIQSIGKVAPDILQGVGELTGIEALEKAGELLDKNTDIDQNTKDFFKEQILLELQDIESARRYNSEIQKSEYASKLAKFTPYIIDLFIMVVWGAMTTFIILKAFNPDIAKDSDMSTIMGIYAAITGKAATVLNFHRGSSIGSKMKDIPKK